MTAPSTRPPAATDVVVAGGGPAGATAAGLLAHLGHSVVLLEAATFPRYHVGESLTPAIHRLFDFLGVREAIAAAGFVRMPGHTFRWAGGERTHDFEDEWGAPVDGYQVVRSRFDALLVGRARELGAAVHHGYRVVSPIEVDGRAAGVRWVAGGSRSGSVRARVVIDATGHHGVLARARDDRRLDQPPRNLALWGYWQGAADPPGREANNTYVESFADGWIWTVRIGDEHRNVTVMVDLDEARPELRRAGVADYYRARIAQTEATRGFVAGARLATRVRGCDATWYRSRRYGGKGLVVIGDAATCIDPLTSQGVSKAIQSGMNGALVANTILDDPGMAATALAFHREEEERTYARYRRETVRTLLEEDTHRDRPFWRRRSASTLGDPGPVPPPLRRSVLRDAVRATPLKEIRLQWAAGTRVETRPVVDGTLIRLRPAVTNAAAPGGRTYPDLEADLLFPLVDGRTPLPEIVDRYIERRRRTPTDRAAVLRLLERLVDDRLCEIVGRS